MGEWLGYTRVSRVGDRAERLISPDQQAERIQSYATARGLDVRMLEPELDVSGGRVERPILGAAIAAVERGEAAGIIVAQLDRLSRMDIADALATIRRIEGAGGQVIAVAENFDAATPEGRLARNMMLALGEMQLDRYKAQFRAAKRQAVERGIWPIPVVPIGYRRGADRRLEPSEDAPRVVRAFEMRAAGASWRVIADLLDKGISGVQKVIRNRVYLGEVNLGEWNNPAAHPPLVDRGLWERAQSSGAPRPPRAHAEPALLGGLVRCEGCGKVMSRSEGTYRCTARKAGGVCPARATISCAVLDAAVERAVLAHLRGIGYSAAERGDRLEAAREALAEAEAELDAYQRAASARSQHFAAGMSSRIAAVEAARRELAGARSAALPSGEVLDLWPGMSVSERRHVLGALLVAVWVRKGRGLGRVRLEAVGDDPDEIWLAGAEDVREGTGGGGA